MVSALLLLSSCATDKVMSDSWIQKRKYTKGFYMAGAGKKKVAEPTIAKEEYIKPTPIENMNSLSASTSINTLELSSVATKPVLKDEVLVKTQNQTKATKASKKLERKIKKVQQKINQKEAGQNSSLADDIALLLLVIIAILLPPLAVGLVTDWDTNKLLISIILTLCLWLPGVIYALYLIFN